MEGENVDISTCGGAPASSRWNPTKEQISMLENLYRQGIRTPSAEQIQQITSRLKAYGHIEGKNVFYWFQNHKARQRQKQKQENMAYYSRYLHNSSPVFPPCPTVVCSPYYLPQNDLGFYPHYPKVLLPGGIKRRPSPDKMEKTNTCVGAGYEPSHLRYNVMMHTAGDKNEAAMNNNCNTSQATLPLFPLQPTGILQARTTNNSSLVSTSAENSTTPSSSSDTTGIEQRSGDQPYFEFFSGNGSYESD
ncbi:hypothetical protein F0562_000934 [Nyssa sinensis]|uniref:Homeobox domain-containing protein n=1 Tax=Nyssa sinensis TaxID=561372 RepID=A0A5J5C598_9ASTE|nr:hypothetical protein F0562_000934 [Nyssa sinensis]